MPLPTGNHGDWLWPFSYIPRSWNAWLGEPPRLIWGTADPKAHLDITAPGTWAITWPLFWTWTTKSKWLARFGARYSYADNERYYTFPSATIKRLG